MKKVKNIYSAFLVVVLLFTVVCFADDGKDVYVASAAAETSEVGTGVQQPTKEETQMEELKAKAEEEKRLEAEKKKMEKAEAKKARQLAMIEKLTLPEDTTAKMDVKEIQISGNNLVTTGELIQNIPVIFNASSLPLLKAESKDLYDLRVIQEILSLPGEVRQVSARTIQGFTQYVLSTYQRRGYSGVYVYVPRETLQEGKLAGDILKIAVIEFPVKSVSINAYDIEQKPRENPRLRRDIIEQWSPVKIGQVVERKKIDDFINLLNLNPDRYMAATISKGAEPNSLAVGYDVYETSPWHYYIQIDNSGTSDRQWKPRLGLINTNLTGRDDKLTLMAQIAPEKGFEDNYAYYGSYDVPIFTPRLRMTFYGGRSQFAVSSGAGFDFVGAGYFYGSILRFNVFQVKTWFFDFTASLAHERSRINPQNFPFPSLLQSNDSWNLWSVGAEVHHRDDLSNTTLAFNHYRSMNEHFRFDPILGNYAARTNLSEDFTINVYSASHSQFLNKDKIHRISGSFKFIATPDRLPPAKMTTFGGLYTVRGYSEDRIVADEGYLYSLQYEFDIIKYDEAKNVTNEPKTEAEKKPLLKRLAPVAFIDGGRAKIVRPIAGTEKPNEDLLGIGFGLICEVGEHFEGAVYAGWPMKTVTNTDAGDPALNASFTARW
jgi:hemolysin activation/secretion protein